MTIKRFPLFLQVRESAAQDSSHDLFNASYVQGRSLAEDRLENVAAFKALAGVEETAPAFDSMGQRAWATSIGPSFYVGNERVVEGKVEAAAFSPDGKRMAYTEQVDPWVTRRLYVSRPDGGDKQRWDFPSSSLGALQFSPDSRKLWFSCGSLYNVDVDTGKYTRVDTRHGVSDFSLSPDGSRLAYFDYDILRCRDLATGEEKTLDDLQRWRYRLGHNPVFSPDGSRVIYACETDDSGELWVVSSHGGKPRQLEAPAVVKLARPG